MATNAATPPVSPEQWGTPEAVILSPLNHAPAGEGIPVVRTTSSAVRQLQMDREASPAREQLQTLIGIDERTTHVVSPSHHVVVQPAETPSPAPRAPASPTPSPGPRAEDSVSPTPSPAPLQYPSSTTDHVDVERSQERDITPFEGSVTPFGNDLSGMLTPPFLAAEASLQVPTPPTAEVFLPPTPGPNGTPGVPYGSTPLQSLRQKFSGGLEEVCPEVSSEEQHVPALQPATSTEAMKRALRARPKPCT